jgi:aminomethyltransferase
LGQSQKAVGGFLLTETELRTPLYDLHVELGAKMVPFAGYSMPVQYPMGVMKEHLHTRAEAGLFDVSHMGQVMVTSVSGRMEDAALALESLVPVDVLALKPGRQRYALFTNDAGGILDDLMIANLGDAYFVVVNAGCKVADIAHLRRHLSDKCVVTELSDRALMALQGPQSEAVLTGLGVKVGDLKFMDVQRMAIDSVEIIVSRSGYSGEDGFEISVSADEGVAVAQKLLANPSVKPIGLGARDSLRLEAGLCLYGHDLGEATNPVEAALDWAIQKSRRIGGARAGGFPGAEVILHQLEHGASIHRVGLLPEGRAPIREGTQLYATIDAPAAVGEVTSGGFGPSLNAPLAMGYVPGAMSEAGMQLFADVRGKRLPVRVAPMPFIKPGYKRN